MIKLKPFKQSKGYCGPASLKMVLSAYGINRSEKYLAKITKTSRKSGCAEEDIVKAVKKFGFRGYVKNNSSIKELKQLVKKGIPVIVDWFSPEESGHFSVVVGFRGNDIFLADPHFGAIKKHKISWFKQRWYDYTVEDDNLREIIVIEK